MTFLGLFHHLFLGGVLGLFTGMSILSLCELVFWVLQTAISPVGRKAPSKKGAVGKDIAKIAMG